MPLYKYIVPERLDILRDFRIRFTQPTALNDPFEFHPLVSGLFRPEVAVKNLVAELERQLPKAIAEYRSLMTPDEAAILAALAIQQKPVMVAQALELIDASSPATIESLVEGLGSALGILSISETPNNILMWTHYAANHAGFVLEFDETHP